MDPVTGAIGKLAPMLVDLLQDEYKLQKGVKVQIRSLALELESARVALSMLDKMPPELVDEQVRLWARHVRDASYDMADILDYFRARTGDRLFSLSKFKAQREIARAIEDIVKQLREVTELRSRYALHNILGKPEATTPCVPGSSGLLGGGNIMLHYERPPVIITRQLVRVGQPLGMVDMPDLEKWMDFEEERKEPGVLSIIGFGGVGKTTIASALYRKFGSWFERRAMVTLSQVPDFDMVLRSILSQVKGKQQGKGGMGTTLLEEEVPSVLSRAIRRPSSNQAEDVLKKHRQIKAELENHLGQKRFLLLIDDVWSSSSWLYIKKCIPENYKGSRVIVTTRFQAVAATCSSRKDHDRVHPVHVLSEGESNDLFHRILDECQGYGHSHLSRRTVPGRVWKMCGGLPLAIVTIAGLVASKPEMTHEYWNEVCDSLFPESQVCRKPEEFMRIINHCYNDLDSDLKTCSLYLSVFPKGSRIRRKRLTRRWIAEGFISEKHGLSVEDVAETCFNQLIERRIIRPVEHSSNGRVKSCQVHDMVLEYLIAKAAEEDFITVVGSHWSMLPTQINKVRRLAVHSSDSNRAKEVNSMDLSHVRSMTVFNSLDKLHFKSLKTRIVQILDLEGCTGFRESQIKGSDICKMILLKYLSLRRTDVRQLPQNIHNLKYLETLDIRETEVQQLPANVGQLERIKNILGGDKRTRKTLKLSKELKGPVKTLRILSGIEIVEGSTFAWDLKYFTELRKLAIYKIHKSDEIFNDLLYSIQYLSGYSLHSLVIDDESSEFLKTLDSLYPYPIDLSALELSGRLLKLPKWLNTLNSLDKLILPATALRTDNLKILSRLGSLFSLTFSISEKQDPALAAILQKNKSASGGEIFVPAGGFWRLKLLRIFVPLLPSVTFAKEATPQLERIELRLRKFEGLHGLDELGMIQDVILTVDGQVNDEMTRLALEDLREGGERSSKYSLIVNESHG